MPGAPRRVGKPTHKGKDGEIYVDDDGKRYKCSSYTRGTTVTSRWYQIDESGARIMGHSCKPPNIDSTTWSRLSEERKLEEIVKHRDNAAPAQAASTIAACAPLGLLGLQTPSSACVTRWTNEDNKLQEFTSLEDYCVRADQLEPEVADEDQEVPWVAWDRFIEELEAPKCARDGADTSAGGDTTACAVDASPAADTVAWWGYHRLRC